MIRNTVTPQTLQNISSAYSFCHSQIRKGILDQFYWLQVQSIHGISLALQPCERTKMTVLLLYSKKSFPDNVSKNHHLFVKPRNPEATTADILDPLCSTAQVKQPTRHLLSSLHQPRGRRNTVPQNRLFESTSWWLTTKQQFWKQLSNCSSLFLPKHEAPKWHLKSKQTWARPCRGAMRLQCSIWMSGRSPTR